MLLHAPAGSLRQWSNYTSDVPLNRPLCPGNGTAALSASDVYSPLCMRFAVYSAPLASGALVLAGPLPFRETANATDPDAGLQFRDALNVTGDFLGGVVVLLTGAVNAGDTLSVVGGSAGPPGLVVAGGLQLGPGAVVDFGANATLTLDRIDFVADAAATVLLRANTGDVTIAGATWSNTAGGAFGGVLGTLVLRV